MTQTLIGIVISVLATWIVAHLYYQRGTKDLRKIVDTLPDSVARTLAQEQRRKLSLRELEDLIHQADAHMTEFGLFPTKCPVCGGPVEIHGDPGSEYSEPAAWPYCPRCDRDL